MPIVDPSLRAAGIIGAWETDVPAGHSVLDEGAAELLAGNASLAGQPVPLEVALRCTHPDDRAWVFDRIRRARHTGGPFSAEFRVLIGSGDIRWVLNRGTLAPDETGGMHGQGAYIDTTDSYRRPFLPIQPAEAVEGDLLLAATDRCMDAQQAIDLVGDPGLQQLSALMLLTIGRALARRART